MTLLRCRSFAKVNLHLEVVRRRADGYHELRTLFQTVALHDVLEVELVDGTVSLEVVAGAAPGGDDNLATRAARELLRIHAPRQGVSMRLHKRIPIAAGLGGGSSNAATALWALHRLLGEPESIDELSELAAGLGADVPYFLIGGTAWGIGRGDQILPLRDLEEGEIWLVTPPVEISTAEVFARYGKLTQRATPSSIIRLVQGGAGYSAEELEGFNDLEAVVLQHHPVIRETRAALLEAGGAPVRLSGSGGTLFTFFRAPVEVEALRRRMPAGIRIERTRTLSRRSFDGSRIID